MNRLNQIVLRGLARIVTDNLFGFWEKHGFHLTPVSFYSPIPDTRELKDDLWENESELPGIELNLDVQLHMLTNVFPRFREEHNQFPRSARRNPDDFYFDNPMFGGTDALVLYCMLRNFRPNLIVEVGSGYSTRISSKAAVRNGNTQIRCIEPHADDVIGRLPRVAEVIPYQVQDVGLDFFQQLGSGDILFIDTSHTVKCGGDVNYLCLEVLPRLRNGVIVHFHDIFLPKEYPKEWVMKLHRFWNEQYLIHAFLVFNSEFEILFLNSYMGLKFQEKMKAIFPNSPWWGGGSCWIRRKLNEPIEFEVTSSTTRP
jgi:hypothetical protein